MKTYQDFITEAKQLELKLKHPRHTVYTLKGDHPGRWHGNQGTGYSSHPTDTFPIQVQSKSKEALEKHVKENKIKNHKIKKTSVSATHWILDRGDDELIHRG